MENKARARSILEHLQRRGDVRFIDHATLYAERAETRRDLNTPIGTNFVRYAEAPDDAYAPIHRAEDVGKAFLPSIR